MLYNEKTKQMFTSDGRYTGFTFEKGDILVDGIPYTCENNTAFATLETAEKIVKLLRVVFPTALITIRSGVVDPPLVHITPQLRVVIVYDGDLVADSNAGLAAANIIAGGPDAILDEYFVVLSSDRRELVNAIREKAAELGIITNVTPLPQPGIKPMINASDREG